MKKAKKRFLYFGLPILIVVGIVIWRSSTKSDAEYSTIIAEASNLTQTVSETGTIKPVKEMSLNFQTTGKVATIDVAVGDSVEEGDLLASLDDSSLLLRKAESEAGLQIAQSNLNKVYAGADRQDINISRQSLEQAKSTEESARNDLKQIENTIKENIRQAQKNYDDLMDDSASTPTNAESAVVSAEVSLSNAKQTAEKNLANAESSLLLVLNDKILSVKVAKNKVQEILDDDNISGLLSVLDTSYKSEVKTKMSQIEDEIVLVEGKIARAKELKTESSILLASSDLANLLENMQEILDLSYEMLENTITSADFSQTELDALKTMILGQSTNINTANNSLEGTLSAYKNAISSYDTSIASAEDALSQANVSLQNTKINALNSLNNIKLSSEQQYLSAKTRLENAINAKELAQAQYDKVVAPARTEDLSLAQAQVNQAQAALESIEKQIIDAKIYAPLSGVITEINYEVGEQYSGSVGTMIKMLVDNNFNIEVDISESNISKVKINDKTEITLDAFSDDFVLDGHVSFIEPAQTLISGVVYYKVKVEFNDLDKVLVETKKRGLNLKSGMTANVVITTDEKDNVISVPSRAIIEENGVKYLRLLVNEEVVKTPVLTGLRGDNGQIEVQEGVSEGSEVITLIRNGN
ncbi:MAG: efflux RND transporter periplasmic adaptor subunit [Patescibacteria group bacterium]|jgi:HlyD family secretion protein|nr:efflux RND transporter periplasmic adaptor subunit [Patescibacteria group bacterium]